MKTMERDRIWYYCMEELEHQPCNGGPYFGEFSKEFRVIAPDLRGHGRTENPSGELGYSLLANDVAALINELGLQKPHICGWSDGGQIGLDLAIRYPDLAGSYIVGACWKDISESDHDSLGMLGFHGPGDVDFDQLEDAFPEYGQLLRSAHHHQGEEHWKELLVWISRMWYDPFQYNDEDLSKVKTPIFFIIGAKDQFIPVETMVEMYRLVPNADLAVVPYVDHNFPRSHVSEFSDLVRGFLNRE